MAYVFASASRIPSNGVIYVDEQGNKFLWAGGTRTWRNNNPGNMINTEISKSYGSIGTAGGFAVFPDVASGRAALVALLKGTTYSPMTIYAAIERYAPPKENNTSNYRKLITRLTGLDINRKISNLNANEFDSFVEAVITIEGNKAGVITPILKIVGTKRDGANSLTAFLIEGRSGFVSKDKAIQLAEAGLIDAVVVHPKYGEPYLRSFADASSGNNFSNLVVS